MPTMHNPPGFIVLETLLTEGTGVWLRALRGEQPVLLRMSPEEYPSPETLARMRYGHELSARLTGPGIARGIDLLKHGNGWVLVMEDRGERLLRNRLEAGALPLTAALEITLRVARTLGELHRQHVIHKNVSPSSILVHPETFEVRLAHFDIAALLPSEDLEPVARDRPDGSLPYISPEQTGRMNRSLDYRTDFYSLGVTLYELLTGRVPFQGQEPMTLIYSHLAVQPTAPHQVRPEVPRSLSALVMKLLAKNAEDRYQSAYGLVEDLKECLEQLSAAGTISELTPGRRDVPAIFRIPQKLYGREREVARLMESFERVSTGDKAELLLVSGYSGIGKSSLVHEVQRPLVRQDGYFGSGKFDQVHNAPYKVWLQAFDGLLRQLLSESEESIATWKKRFLEALGPNGRVVTDVVPRLEAIIGPQPQVPVLGPLESQNRFNLALQRFVGTFTRPEHPLVLFLDDLQWADASSLGLLQRILGDPGCKNLLLIGAYRDNEVQAGHGLLSVLVDLRKVSASITELSLTPLVREDVQRLLADTLHHPDAAALEALAALVFQKTQGNPFFVTQFITSLHARGLLTFETERGYWSWRLEQLEQQHITDNVAVLMAERIATLPESTQEMLKHAACIGNRFSLETLALIGERSPQQAATDLWEAVQLGLLSPEGEAYKYLQGGDGAAFAQSPSAVRYSFQHDRVQEAAYALMSPDARKRLHLRIGWLLLASTPKESLEASIFDIVNQLNAARELLLSPEEFEKLARLNLKAGQRAMSSSAYAVGLGYLETGISLLATNAWDSQYALAFALHQAHAQCCRLCVRYDLAERDFELMRDHARSVLDKQAAYELRLMLCVDRGQYMQAIEPALQGLAVLGIHLPKEPAELAAITAQLRQKLDTCAASGLADLSATRDPLEKAIVLFMSRACVYAAYVHPQLYQYLVSTLVARSLEHGLAPGSAVGYIQYALTLIQEGNPARAYEFGSVALALSERSDPPEDQVMARFLFGKFVNPWSRPLPQSLAHLERTYRFGLESGSMLLAGWASMNHDLLAQFAHEELGPQWERLQRNLEFFRRLNGIEHQSIYQFGGFQQALLRLMHPEVPAPLVPWHEEARIVKGIENPPLLASYLVLRLRAEYLLEDLRRAWDYATQVEGRLPAIRAWYGYSEWLFYRALLLVEQYPTATAEARAGYDKSLDEATEKLRKWSGLCAENFLAKDRMLAAERARLAGRHAEAVALYDEALQAAEASGYTAEVALAHELAARAHLARGHKRLARAHLEESRYAYTRWGAHGKVAQLERRYPELLRLESSGTEAPSASSLDLISVLKASQAISEEIVLQDLLRKLMSTMLENTGARRGVLLLKGKGLPTVEARQQEGGETTVVLHGDGEGPVQLPLAIVRYVERTGERVVLHEAASEGAFQSEEDVASQRLRSVLCMPVLKQKQLVGTLYLENELVAGAFTPERCRVLELLSAQAAISLENARLYETLEQRVQERTRELHASNEELSQALEQLKKAQAQLVMREKLAWLGVLTSGIAHEIKNPLNFINNFALLSADLTVELEELVRQQRERLEALSAEQLELLATDLRENMKRINAQGQRADGIVRSMLELSRNGGGKPHEVDLNSLVREFSNLATRELRARNSALDLTLELQLDPELGPVEVMPHELGRVMLNLVNNAGHALEQRNQQVGGNLAARIQISTRKLNEGAEIRVWDNGTGIPVGLREKIFAPFFTTKPAGQGTGLGLSISQEIIVQGHSGTMVVKSEEGLFTEFTITLPRRAARLRESLAP